MIRIVQKNCCDGGTKVIVKKYYSDGATKVIEAWCRFIRESKDNYHIYHYSIVKHRINVSCGGRVIDMVTLQLQL